MVSLVRLPEAFISGTLDGGGPLVVATFGNAPEGCAGALVAAGPVPVSYITDWAAWVGIAGESRPTVTEDENFE